MNQFAFYYFFTNFGNKTLKIIDMNKFFKLTSLALLCFSCTDSYDEFSDNVSLKTRATEEPMSFFDKVTAPERWRQFKTLEEMMEACQLPQQMLDTISTEGLIKLCYDYPLHSIYLAYNNQSEGINVITSNFNGFHELKNRPDATEKIIDFYDNLYLPVYLSASSNENDFTILKLNYIENILASNLLPEIQSPENKEKLEQAIQKKIQLKRSAPEIYSTYSLTPSIRVQKFLQGDTLQNQISDDSENSINTFQMTASPKQVKVYTYLGTEVEGFNYDEMSNNEINSLNNYAKTAFPNATYINTATRSYNCHSYAWNITDGGATCWINHSKLNDATSNSNIKAYWSDFLGYTETTNEAEATKIHYYQSDHSAVKSSVPGYYESKWGSGPLMRHAPGYGPYTNMDKRHYYKFGVNYTTTEVLNCSTGSGTTRVGIASTYNTKKTYTRTTKYVWRVENAKGEDVTDSPDVSIDAMKTAATITFHKIGNYTIYCECYYDTRIHTQWWFEALVEP